RARDDLGRAAVDQLGQLGDGQELVDADGLRLLRGETLTLRLTLEPARRLLAAVPASPAAGPQLRHHALDVLLHRLLVHPLPLLLAFVLLAAAVAREAFGLDADLTTGARARSGRRRRRARRDRPRRRQPLGHPARTRTRLRRGLPRRC